MEPSRITLAVKVTPKADKDAVVGWRDSQRSELLLRVSAAPESGKANSAVQRLLAGSLGIPKSTVQLLRGQGSRQKLFAFPMSSADFEAWKERQPTGGR